MPYDNVWVDAVLWAVVVVGYAGYGWWAWRKQRRQANPSDPRLPLSHVRPVGPRRRCARCLRVRVTMDLADGWGPGAAVLPYCGPCCRDLVGDDEEVVA